MASHLSVTTAANPGAPAKGLNGQAAADTGKDVFAALLGNAAPVEETPEPAKAAPAAVAPAAAGLVELALDGDAGTSTDDKPDETPDPVAVPVDVVVPIQQPLTPQALLTGIIDGLTALRAAAQNGQTPPAADLAKLNQDLQTLADTLGLSLDQLPSMDDLAAMASQPLQAGATPEAQLVATLAPLAQGALTDATATTTDAAVADQLKAIGDKLAALVKSLNDGAVDLDAMAGTADDKAALDADLQAALDRLLKPAAETIKAAAAPHDFVAPALQTTQSVLTGKPTDAAPPKVEASESKPAPTTEPSVKPADPVVKADVSAAKNDASEQRDKLKDAKVDATVAAATRTVETPADNQPSAQTGTPTVTTRLEATPGPRPVISGYQTSQQQLNLPQIAFELVRQVNDGHSRFQMRLDPPELGRIDVRLDIDRSGQVTARLTVEKAETLDLMQRDQRGLEKALQQAGLDSSKTNLEFSLKQNPFSGQQGQNQGGQQPSFGGDSIAEAEEPPAPQINLYRASLSASGVNIIA